MGGLTAHPRRLHELLLHLRLVPGDTRPSVGQLCDFPACRSVAHHGTATWFCLGSPASHALEDRQRACKRNLLPGDWLFRFCVLRCRTHVAGVERCAASWTTSAGVYPSRYYRQAGSSQRTNDRADQRQSAKRRTADFLQRLLVTSMQLRVAGYRKKFRQVKRGGNTSGGDQC